MAISQKQVDCDHQWTISCSTLKGTRKICNKCGLDLSDSGKYADHEVLANSEYPNRPTEPEMNNVPKEQINCVYIEYYDVVGKSETWNTMKEAIEWAKSDIGLNKVVGWVIEMNDKFTLIGSHKADFPNSDDDQWGQLTRIPTSLITKKINLLPIK